MERFITSLILGSQTLVNCHEARDQSYFSAVFCKKFYFSLDKAMGKCYTSPVTRNQS